MPKGRFPFDPTGQTLPEMATRLPLSPHCNPPSAHYSLGVFHRSPIQLLASFAGKVSGAIALQSVATDRDACLPLPAYPRKAGYAAHSTRFCAMQVHTCFVRGLRQPNGMQPPSHNNRSPRKPGRIFHAVGMRPGSLTPSTHPKLGVKSRHQGLHRYALQRIFRPFLGAGCSD